jgi:hypothetical protein
VKTKIAFLAILIGIVSFTAEAQSAFTASVDKDQVAFGDYFQLTFTFEGSQGGKNFRPPAFNNFMVLSGPNQSTRMQIVNGAVSSSISYTYILQPRDEGKFTIGSASIEAEGKKYQSQPITIEVVKGTAQPRSKRSENESPDVRSQIGNNLMIKAVVDRTKVYQGEQITVSYKVYTRVQILSYNVAKSPSFTGFWSEDLEVPKQIQTTNEMVNGKEYAVGLLRKLALFPQRSGTLSLDPMEIEVTVPIHKQSHDFFDNFFDNSTPVQYKTATDPVTITVQPLPSENIPAGFTGAVGLYQMETHLDKQDVKTNDAVTLRVKISGQGNLKLLEPPPISFPADLEKFDPKISNSLSTQGNRIAGSRTFEYLLIPRHSGDQKIPSFTFSYFDTVKQKFVSLRSPEFVLKVQRGSEPESTGVAGINREDVKLLGEDIRFIKSGNISFQRKGESFVGSALFYVLYISPLFLFILFLVFLKQKEKEMLDVVSLRSRKARKIAKQRLSNAKKLLAEKKKEEFYAEVSRALWGYLTDRLKIPPSDLNRETISSTLQQRAVSSDTISSIISTMEQCEFARFAPQSDSLQMEVVFKDTVQLVTQIEDQLQ